ncbi:MAG: NPCBM-associated, NEW3 domain of alpha-galactosidase [Methanosaeta sp. PtaU1.Bin055]|nr:MAG: NPCBM-associated, NEW3 domain of alpha-galactosidase [Methanosaeta sp. PtaU1.Bin055]
MNADRSPSPKFASPSRLFMLLLSLLLVHLIGSSAVLQGSPNALERFPDDFYKVEGSPEIAATLERSRVYQGEETSLYLTLTNRGRVTSIEVNDESSSDAPWEVYAAKVELELENARTAAQDVSVSLIVPGAAEDAPLEVKRQVAYAGTLREGQVSSRLEFPIEVYENAPPGDYDLVAQVNYAYQWDVAAEPKSSRPESPDIFYLYESKSETIPLVLRVERESGAEFKVLNVTPSDLKVASKENVVQVTIENVGDDYARDLVARLRPESGIYVSVDESPIPLLRPGETAELVYKLDVSKDAVPEKTYSLKVLFEFSDSRNDDLFETENVYLRIEEDGPWDLIVGAVLVALAAAGLLVLRQRRGMV